MAPAEKYLGNPAKEKRKEDRGRRERGGKKKKNKFGAIARLYLPVPRPKQQKNQPKNIVNMNPNDKDHWKKGRRMGRH